MRNRALELLAFPIVALAGATGAIAGAVTPEMVLEQCGVVAEKEARIACYDRLNPPRASDHARAAAAAAAPSPQPAPISAPVPEPPQTRIAEFGLSDQMKRQQRAGEEKVERAPAETMVARVQKVSQRPHGELLLVLDNGQTWAQTERRVGTIINVGDSVKIAKGVLGSFQLVASSGASAWVKRIQ